MKILLIYNLSSGNGKIMQSLSKIKSFFDINNFLYDIYDIRAKDEVSKDMMLLSKYYDTFVIAGGDGTIHSVINGIMAVPMDERPKLLFLPFGTTNDFANMLGIGKDIDFNLALLKTNHYRKSDVYALNNEFFVYAAAVGKFSNVSYRINRRKLRKFGPIGYLLNARNDIFKKYNMNIEVETNAFKINKKTFLILIASGSRLGGFNISKFSKNPKLNDGKIDVRIFTRTHFFSWIKLIIFYLLKGKKFYRDIHINTNYIHIKLDGNYIWNVDGEKGPIGDIKVYTLQKQIEVYVHPNYIDKMF
ncbi:diacylglycerol/lipid kinase family protein [Acholeplasma granularum]|uniref:diacylglycerol/lipid kinase family protein n=1 Tax=Acholeplasma granularum TaxID=264635 RepID=UPI000470B9D5|nr:YegS/Rv2252/BmrU family lipid kinase [Acholeplasma granularum]